MNKIKYFISLLTIATLFGCMEEEWIGNRGDIQVSAGFANTRTTFVEDNGTTHVDWETGDVIGLITDEQRNLSYSAQSAGSEVLFTATADKLKASEGETVYAYYPYSSTGESEKEVYLPDIMYQYHKENASEYDFIYASNEVAENKVSLQFKHLYAFLKITLPVNLWNDCKENGGIWIRSNEALYCRGYFDIEKEQVNLMDSYDQVYHYIPNEHLEGKQKITCYIAIMPQTENAVLNVHPFKDEGVIGDCILTKNAPAGGLKAGNVYTLYFDETDIEKERDALVAIYNALDGEHWTNNTNWCSDKPVGEWYGVSCNSFGAVTRLELYDNVTSGNIPAEIGNLKNLEYLRIGDTNISSIPQEIGELTNLTWLDIWGHKITSVPTEIDNLVKLKYLGISGENIVDFKPTFSSLTDLEQISLSLPKINSIPQGIFSLDQLISLSCRTTFSEIPAELRNMTQLQWLEFSRSNMNGLSIPSWLSELTKLKYLSLYGCGLIGNIPEEIGNLTNLENLSLGENSLTGTIPSSFSNLTKLQELNIRYNQLSGTIPEGLVNLPFFKYRWGEIITGNNFDLSEMELYAPEFTVTDIEGNTIVATDIYTNNKYTILYQWRPAENTDQTTLMKKLYEEYKDKGLEMIAWTGDSVDEIRAANTPWINFKRGIETGNYFYINQDPYYTIEAYPMWYMGTPSITIVDSNKKVVYSNVFSDRKIENFLAEYIDGIVSDAYTSTDYSADGTVRTIQTASEGNGIDIVFMGDAFSDRQIIGGDYDRAIDAAAEMFFIKEPYASYKDYFNVYAVTAVSKNEGYTEYGETAFDGYFGDGTLVGGNDNAAFNYAQKAISADRMDNAIIIVLMNKDAFGGTCYMYSPSISNDYGSGVSVAYFPVNSDASVFESLLHHEACGHGFAKLDDEYVNEGYEVAPSEYIINRQQNQADWGWWKNVDFTSDPTAVRWAKFLNDERYADEGLGVFEGGSTYSTGIWRPTENSIMRYNTGMFNAPSREAIYYRIHKLAYGDSWEYDYEEFVEYDAINRVTTKTRVPYRIEEPKQYIPTTPPVVIGRSWRD